MPTITVFTPTYNRAYIIENLYRSLQNQTTSDFEWLVIDDGSKDNTKELFTNWILENTNFPIRYYKVENGGKHRAINKATDIANGKLFFIVDSVPYSLVYGFELESSMLLWYSSYGLRWQVCWGGEARRKGKFQSIIALAHL